VASVSFKRRAEHQPRERISQRFVPLTAYRPTVGRSYVECTLPLTFASSLHRDDELASPPLSSCGGLLASFKYQTKSRENPRRVVAKIEWHQGELFPRVGLIVTKLRCWAVAVDWAEDPLSEPRIRAQMLTS